MKHTIFLHKSKYGYDVRVSALPGCHSQGDSEKDASENIKDAIRMYLGMKQEKFKSPDSAVTPFIAK